MARAEAHKLPSGTWRCKANYTDENGKHKQKSFTGKTKREAELLADDFLKDIHHYQEPNSKTLRMLIDEHIADQSNILSPSTIRGYTKIRNTALQEIMDVPVSKLKSTTYQSALNEYVIGHSYKTVANAHALVRCVLRKNDIYIAEKTKLPKKVKKEKEIPSPDEMKVFLSKISDEKIYYLCLLSSAMGLRRSEILGLQWKDVDIKRKKLSIQRARVLGLDNAYFVKYPKAYDSTRILLIPQIVLDALPEAGKSDAFVYNGSIASFDDKFKKLAKKYDFPYTFHSLRHFYASVLLMEGVPNKYAQQLMGHSTDRMLQEVYQHTFTEQMDKYEAEIGNSISLMLSSKGSE